MLIINLQKKAVFIAGLPMKGLEKFILGNGFGRYKRRKKDNVIPMFDHYNAGFNACDRFNRVLHGKSWPYRLYGDHRVCSNYSLAFVLINTDHLWMDSGTEKENRKNASRLKFCTELAFEMIK